jgi:hypothetical protein
MSKTMHLKAIRPLTYATRRLVPGDVFEVPERHGKILLATRKTKLVREPAAVAPPPPAVAEKIVQQTSEDELKLAREKYETVIGRRPYYGWDAETLRSKISEAQHLAVE